MYREYDRVAIFFAILFICTITTGFSLSSDTKPAALLPYVLVLQPHSFYFDSVYDDVIAKDYWSGGFILVKNHWVSKYPIVTPMIVMPLYVFQFMCIVAAPSSINYLSLLARWNASFICAIAGMGLYLVCRRLFSREIAILTTIVFSFGTVTWVISSQQLWEHGLSELLLVVSLLIIVLNEEKPHWKYFVYLGLVSGLFVMNRPSDFPLLIPIFVYILLNWKEVNKYLISAFISAAPFIYYNYTIFGNVIGWYSNLAHNGFGVDYFHPTDFYGRAGQAIVGFAGQWISINRGLLVFCPILIFSFYGMWLVYRSSPSRVRTVLLWSIPAILITTALYSCFIWWYGGGMAAPRYLTGALPYLVIFCGYAFREIWENKHKWLVAVFVMLLIISIFIEIISAWGYPFSTWESPSKDSRDDMWDLNNSLILNSYHSLERVNSIWALPFPALPRPYGMFPIWKRNASVV